MPGFQTSSLQTVREQISAVKATQSVEFVTAARGNEHRGGRVEEWEATGSDVCIPPKAWTHTE